MSYFVQLEQNWRFPFKSSKTRCRNCFKLGIALTIYVCFNLYLYILIGNLRYDWSICTLPGIWSYGSMNVAQFKWKCNLQFKSLHYAFDNSLCISIMSFENTLFKVYFNMQSFNICSMCLLKSLLLNVYIYFLLRCLSLFET